MQGGTRCSLRAVARPKRTYGGVSADERLRRRRDALLRATLDLIADDGVASVSKRAVCARAQLNDRYFYEHFADSDALLAALAGEMAAELAGAMSRTLDDVDGHLPDQVRSGIEGAIDFFEADASRVALLLGPPASESLVRAREAAVRTVADALADAFLARAVNDRLDRLDTTMVAYACVSGARDLLAAWMRGEFDASRRRVVRLMTAMVLAIADMATPVAVSIPGPDRR